MQGPVMQDEAIVSINRNGFACFGMDDEKTHHAIGQLGHLVRMGMVHMAAMLAQGELVGKGLAGLNVRLIKPADAVHPVGQD